MPGIAVKGKGGLSDVKGMGKRQKYLVAGMSGCLRWLEDRRASGKKRSGRRKLSKELRRGRGGHTRINNKRGE